MWVPQREQVGCYVGDLGKSPASRAESDTRYTDLFVSVTHEIRPLVHEPASLFKQVSPRIGVLGGVAEGMCQRRFAQLPTNWGRHAAIGGPGGA